MNADGIIGANEDILAYNLYAYCGNNPTTLCDSKGYTAAFLPWLVPAIKSIFDIISAAAVGTAQIATAVTGILVAADIISKSSTTKRQEKKPTIIYRRGSSTNHNLTPRASDYNGLSFTTIKPSSGKYVETTVEAINATAILKAKMDINNPTHYLIVPTNELTLHEWQLSRETANEKPHFYTITLKSVLWDSHGNYCGIEGE